MTPGVTWNLSAREGTAQGDSVMATLHVIGGAGETPARPVIRKIGFADLKDAIGKGIDDFKAMPTHVILLAIIYPVVGLILARLTLGYDMMPILFPLAAGFALIGPFAALGFYELSRRREEGLDTSWAHAFEVVRSSSADAIAALGLLLVVLFLVWLGMAQWLYQSLFGYGTPESAEAFLRNIFTTREGWILIVAGNAIGFLFAVAVFSVGVISFPLLLDRDVGAIVAMHTSVKAVLANPAVMAAWALFIAVTLFIGALTFFAGLAVVMPILGHASWHLYRKVVVADASPRPQVHHEHKRRYAADFPSSLFPWARERK
jgi:uncharacterized membrane protein